MHPSQPTDTPSGLGDETLSLCSRLAVIFAAAAAVLLLLASTIGFSGLDRLLPDGAPFLPYFIT